MIIAATSDIQLPDNYQEFLKAIDRMRKKPDLFLIAGNVVQYSDLKEYEKFYNMIFGRFSCPIVSCFGNMESDKFREDVKAKYNDINFLDDKKTRLDIDGKSVGIFGTVGGLDNPTEWQISKIPGIKDLFERRIEITGKALGEMEENFKILLIHYAPTYRTLQGESMSSFSSIGSSKYEDIISSHKPDFVLHGHSQKGTKSAFVGSTPIFNVSFPVNKNIVMIDTNDFKKGLSRFF